VGGIVVAVYNNRDRGEQKVPLRLGHTCVQCEVPAGFRLICQLLELLWTSIAARLMQLLQVIETRLLQAYYQPLIMRQEPVRHCLRNEANEALADTRPQVPRNRRRIHWNTLRICRGPRTK